MFPGSTRLDASVLRLSRMNYLDTRGERFSSVIDQIRSEVANLTVAATEKVTRKSLDDEDHRRLVEEALQEFDFAALAGDAKNGGGE